MRSFRPRRPFLLTLVGLLHAREVNRQSSTAAVPEALLLACSEHALHDISSRRPRRARDIGIQKLRRAHDISGKTPRAARDISGRKPPRWWVPGLARPLEPRG